MPTFLPWAGRWMWGSLLTGQLRAGADSPGHSQVSGAGMALKLPVKARRSQETKGLGMPMGTGILLASERGKVLSPQSGSFQLRALNPKAWRHFRLSQLGGRDEVLLASRGERQGSR